MQRATGLRCLSDDHHQGLVLALKAKKAASGAEGYAVAAIWAEVVSRFERELEPHFQIEERHLAPLLSGRGASSLVARLDEDHAALRQLIAEAERSAENLGIFAERLQQHIRFEERELFEAAQQALGKSELEAVAEACLAVRGGA